MIKEVIYKELDIPVSELNDFYFYSNLSKSTNYFLEDYEKFEIKQTEIKNKEIKKIKDKNQDIHLDELIFGISSIKNKAVIIV